jgi:hypothetical protein
MYLRYGPNAEARASFYKNQPNGGREYRAELTSA